MPRIYKIPLLTLVLILLGISAHSQEDEAAYPVSFTAKIGMGPTYLAVDYGFHFHNQFEVELGRFVTLSASIGTASAYEGLEDIQRWYFPPDIEIQDDDRLRQQSLIHTNLGMQITPVNAEHHKLYAGIGPSFNIYNWSKAELQNLGDSLAIVFTNSQSNTITFGLFGGYDLILGEHIVLGISLYYARFTESMYSVLLNGGYRF